MTVIRSYKVNTPTSDRWTVQCGGGYHLGTWGAVSFTPPSGYTFVDAKSEINYTSDSYNNTGGTISLGKSGASISASINSWSGTVTATWSNVNVTNFIASGTGSGSGGPLIGSYISCTVMNITFRYSKSSTVTKGNKIKATDFTSVGLSATAGQAISNSNFSKNVVITASDWNAKTINL